MDALSEVLRMIRLQGALCLNGRFHEPWCLDAPRGAELAAVLCPGAEGLALLHLVLEGRCWIQLPGGEPIPLQAGDVATVPRGNAHLIGSGLQHAPVERRHALPVRLPEVASVRYGGDGDPCMLVCGWFAYEPGVPNPVLAALPSVFRVAVGRRPAGSWIEASIRYALQEAAAGQPGSTAVAARVAESLFVEALRGYLDDLPPEHTGWFAGLRDPQVGRCVALMHAHPGRPWSVEALAQQVNLSRSVLAERFSGLLGTPPMQYLKRLRLALAARMLSSEGGNLIQVAEAVGYESEASFSRAFKSEYGVPPGAWRSNGRGAGAGPNGHDAAD